MNGKTLKVVEYNLSFGSSDRMVNVFSVFRYKPTNNLYVIYADINIDHNIIHYGSSHIKDKSLLSMACQGEKEEEMIKEFIFKTIHQEELSDFEIISLAEIEGIEIINSNHLEVKKEVLDSLTEQTIPKKKEEQETPPTKQPPTRKKKSKKVLFVLILLLLCSAGLYFYLKTLTPKDTTSKYIICAKEYQHETLKAMVTEENTYYFNNQDQLERYETKMTYQFQSNIDYQNFINKGTIYRYMPKENVDGGWDKEDDNWIFKVMTKEKIDTSYDKPTAYEKALTYYKKEGYRCEEKLGD